MTLAISDGGARDALSGGWIAHLRALDNAAENTLKAYQTDLIGFLAFLGQHLGGPQGGRASLARIGLRDMRAWMADERARGGSSARTLARKLSAVKNFYRWLSDRDDFDATAVLSTRAPKFTNKLPPRPLAAEAAKRMIETAGDQAHQDWVGARDMAVVTLMYGCGLRVSEALGLTGAAVPLPDVLRITGKGGKERLVPVLPAAREALDDYLALCPHPLEPDEPLFRGGVRGGGALAPPDKCKKNGRGRAAATGPSRIRHAARHAPQFRDPPAECGR